MTEEVGVKVGVQVDGAKTLSSLKKDLKEAQGEALAISRQFGETSKEAQEAAKKVAMIKDEVADLNERVKLMDPGAKFQVFGNVVNSVAAGFTAAQGAMALFGGESEDLQKQLVKLQGAMAFTEGLSTLTDSWKDFQRLGAVIKSQVVTAFTTLRGALIATGIGAAVVAVGALAANFEKVEEWLKKIIPGFEGFGKAFLKVKAVAMGVMNSIIESFKVVGEIIVDVFSGDFSEAIDTAKGAGKRIGAAYNEGFQEEIKDQAAEAARAAVQSQIEADEVRLRLLRAGGEKRAKEAFEVEKKIARAQIDAQVAGSKEQRDAIIAYAELLEKNRTEQAKKAEEDAKKAKADREKAAADALKALQFQQELEYRRAVLAGNDMYLLKAQQLQAQLDLAKKYGVDLAEIQNQQAAEELARRETLTKNLNAAIETNNSNIATGLKNVAAAQAGLAQQNADVQLKAAMDTAEAERRKQAAMQATNELMEGLIAERESLSDLEKGAVIATMIATEFAEGGKRDAMELTQSFLKVAAKVLGETSAVGKAVAIANTTIDTIKSASGVFSGMVSTIPGPVGIALGVAGAAAALISGYARVKQITSVKIPGANGAGGAALPAIPAAPSIPRAQDNTGTMVQQLDQVNSNLQQPQRVQVVESDITNTQNRVQVIENNAKF